MSEPLPLEPIRERDAQWDDGAIGSYNLLRQDRRLLLAEVDRLRAQIAGVREHAEDTLSGLDDEQAAKLLRILGGAA